LAVWRVEGGCWQTYTRLVVMPPCVAEQLEGAESCILGALRASDIAVSWGAGWTCASRRECVPLLFLPETMVLDTPSPQHQHARPVRLANLGPLDARTASAP